MAESPSSSDSCRDAPKQLFTSEEMLRVFFDLATVGMVFVNPDGTLAGVNQAYAQITGYPPEELIGRPVLDMTHPDDRTEDRIHYEAYLRGEKPLYAVEKRYLRKDGAIRWVEVKARLVHHADGTPRFSVGIIEDITDRKVYQEALAASEERFRLAAAAAHAMVYDICAATMCVAGMQGLQPLLGFEPSGETMTLEWWYRRIHPDDLPKCRVTFEQMHSHAGAPKEPLQYRVFHKDGRELVVEDTATTLCDGAGKLVRVVGTVVDITRRHQAEQALRHNEARYHTILANMYSAVLLMTNDGRVEYANPAFCRGFGLQESPEQLVGLRSHEILAKVTKAYRHPREAAARIYEIIARGVPVRTEEVELSDGRTCIRDFVPLKIGDQIYGRFWFQTDITERKLAEHALRQSEAQRQLNEILENRVAERTAELLQANEELTRFNRAAVNRELRMIELKKQVNQLCLQAGQVPPYTLASEVPS
jgi:PAS domain S-box-containing protein